MLGTAACRRMRSRPPSTPNGPSPRDAQRIGQWTAFRKYADETRSCSRRRQSGHTNSSRTARTRRSRSSGGRRTAGISCDGRTAINRGPWAARRQVERLFHHRLEYAGRRAGSGSMTAATTLVEPSPCRSASRCGARAAPAGRRFPRDIARRSANRPNRWQTAGRRRAGAGRPTER